MNDNFKKAISQNQNKIKPHDTRQDELLIPEKDMKKLENFLQSEVEKMIHLEKVSLNISLDEEKNIKITPVENKFDGAKVGVAYLSLIKAKQKNSLS